MFGIDDLLIGVIAAVVVDIIANIAKALAVKNPDESVEELGDRVIQAEENDIRPENYDKHDEFLKAIHEFKVDPERSKEISTEEKTAKGVSCLLAGIAEKSGLNTGVLSLAIKGMNNNADFFKEIERGLIKEVVANPKFLEDLGKFIGKEKIDSETFERTRDTLAKIIIEENPNVLERAAKDQIRDLRK